MAINKVVKDGVALIDLSADTVTSAADIVSGKKGHLQNGEQVTGTAVVPSGTINITSNGTKNVTGYASANVNVQPSLQSKSMALGSAAPASVTPGSGYDGLSSVAPNIDTSVIKASNIAEGATILGIAGTHSGAKIEQSKTLTLGAAAPVTVTPDSGKVLSSVPVVLDTSVIKAENIAKDVQILGVTGTHEGGGGGDASRFVATTLPSSVYYALVAYGNGMFVTVPTGGNKAAYSTDGIHWTSATLPSSANWYSVTYGNGMFVAVAAGNAGAAYSTDGIQWASATLPSSATWCSLTYGNGMFVTVASGSNKAAYSTDGVQWTSATLPASANWYSVTYGNGMFVTVTESSNKAAYSTDGVQWTSATLPSSANWYSVTYGNGMFVAITGGNGIAAYCDVRASIA